MLPLSDKHNSFTIGYVCILSQLTFWSKIVVSKEMLQALKRTVTGMCVIDTAQSGTHMMHYTSCITMLPWKFIKVELVIIYLALLRIQIRSPFSLAIMPSSMLSVILSYNMENLAQGPSSWSFLMWPHLPHYFHCLVTWTVLLRIHCAWHWCRCSFASQLKKTMKGRVIFARGRIRKAKAYITLLVSFTLFLHWPLCMKPCDFYQFWRVAPAIA